MADDAIKYELKTVRTLRGTEAMTSAKWQREGWEFVSQTPGVLQTQLTFRRPERKTQWKLIGLIGGGVALLVGFAVVMAAITGGDKVSEPVVSASPSAAAPSAKPTEEPDQSPESTEPAEQEVLTVENSSELEALLIGPEGGPSVRAFAEASKGRLIEFDANIAALTPHGDYKTRFDILITYGDYSETHSFGGPNFQFSDVNIVSDLNLSGGNIPDSVGRGDNIRVVARVGIYDDRTTLFQLEPVSTLYR